MSDNLIRNGDFKENDGAAIKDWQVKGQPVRVHEPTGITHCLLIQEAEIFQSLHLEKNASYSLTFKYRGNINACVR